MIVCLYTPYSIIIFKIKNIYPQSGKRGSLIIKENRPKKFEICPNWCQSEPLKCKPDNPVLPTDTLTQWHNDTEVDDIVIDVDDIVIICCLNLTESVSLGLRQ